MIFSPIIMLLKQTYVPSTQSPSIIPHTMTYPTIFSLAMLNAMADLLAAKLVRPLAHGIKNELEAYIVTAIQRELRNFVPFLLFY
jgi:hypothetical protein